MKTYPKLLLVLVSIVLLFALTAVGCAPDTAPDDSDQTPPTDNNPSDRPDQTLSPLRMQETESITALIALLRSDRFDQGGDLYYSTVYDNYVEIVARSCVALPADIKSDYLARCSALALQYGDPATDVICTDDAYPTYYNLHMANAMQAMGQTPVVEGFGLLHPYYSYRTATGGDYPSIYTLNPAYLALRLGGEIPAVYRTKDGTEHQSDNTFAKMEALVVDLAFENGGWGYVAGGVETFDVDTTAMTVYSFASYCQSEAFKAAAKAGLDRIKEKLNADGAVCVDSWAPPYQPLPNLSSTATTLTALCAAGQSVADFVDVGGKQTIDFVLSMRITDGTEKGLFAAGAGLNADSFSTTDGMRALISCRLAAEGKGSFYRAL